MPIRNDKLRPEVFSAGLGNGKPISGHTVAMKAESSGCELLLESTEGSEEEEKEVTASTDTVKGEKKTFVKYLCLILKEEKEC